MNTSDLIIESINKTSLVIEAVVEDKRDMEPNYNSSDLALTWNLTSFDEDTLMIQVYF